MTGEAMLLASTQHRPSGDHLEVPFTVGDAMRHKLMRLRVRMKEGWEFEFR